MTVTVHRPSDAAADVTGFRFEHLGSATKYVDFVDGHGQLTYLPTTSYDQLHVRLVDRAGNVGPATTHTLQLSTTLRGVAWFMDDADSAPAGTTAGFGLDGVAPTGLVFGDGVSWEDAGGDPRLHIGTTGGGAHTESPVLDPSQPFTLTAKLQLDSAAPDVDVVAASIDGSSASSVALGYNATTGTYGAWVPSAEGGERVFMDSHRAPVTNPFCGFPGMPGCDGRPFGEVLVLVRSMGLDGKPGDLSLVVSGPGRVVTASGAGLDAAAAGLLRVGRAQADGAVLTTSGSGSVDDVLALDSALLPDEAGRIGGVDGPDDVPAP